MVNFFVNLSNSLGSLNRDQKGIFMSSKTRLLLGAHISVAGGFDQAIVRGDSIGCTALQIFTKSSRQWKAKKITETEAQLFKDVWQQYPSVGLVVTHASYLINLGSDNEELYQKSTHALVDELERCALLRIPYLVVHPGSRGQSPREECLKRIANALDSSIAKFTKDGPMILVETMAGQGSSVCSTFEDFAFIFSHMRHADRVAICFDTCHAFAAGYDFRNQESYTALWKQFDETIGLKKIKLFHFNDSKNDFGSHVDRHEEIGKGKIGLKAFELLINDPQFFDIPKILETPKESLEDDARNLATITSLLTQKTREILIG